MATTAGNVLMGACTVYLGDYSTGTGTSGTADVGHTNGPVEWNPAFTNAEVNSERQMGPIKMAPTGSKYTVKVPMLETTLDFVRVATRQAAAQLTTTTLTTGTVEKLLLGNPTEQYHRLVLTGPGPTVNGISTTRNTRFWKAMVESVGPLVAGKAVPTVAEITFAVMADDSQVTTGTAATGVYGEIADVAA